MASSIAIPELTFLSPRSTSKRCFSLSRNPRSRISLSRNRGCGFGLRSRIRAAKEDAGGVVVEERERKLIESGNGAAATASTGGNGYALNGSVERHSIGSATVVESGNGTSNGSLVKYVKGNGAAATAAAGAEVVAEVRDAEMTEEGRKKRIEEIGKEDAWFKKSGAQKVEVWVFDVCLVFSSILSSKNFHFLLN